MILSRNIVLAAMCLSLTASAFTSFAAKVTTVSTRSRETPLLTKVIGGLGEYRRNNPASPSFRCEIYPSSVFLHHHVTINRKSYDLTVDSPNLMSQRLYTELKDLIKRAYSDQDRNEEKRLFQNRNGKPQIKIAAQHTYRSQDTYAREISTRFTLLEVDDSSVRRGTSRAARELVEYVNKICVPSMIFPDRTDFRVEDTFF